MTTITYRDGVMAADSSLSDGGLNIINHYPKIKRNQRGDLAGAAGNSGYCDKFLDWFAAGEKGEKPEAGDNDGALICRANGEKELYDNKGMSYLRCKYYAIGSGYKVAVGAMWMGATAHDAVVCAAEHDVYTRLPIVELTHEQH